MLAALSINTLTHKKEKKSDWVIKVHVQFIIEQTSYNEPDAHTAFGVISITQIYLYFFTFEIIPFRSYQPAPSSVLSIHPPIFLWWWRSFQIVFQQPTA